MADNKKYYYLKLKESFFDSDKMIVLENMQDGYLYSNILLKLYLKSLKGEGRLMFNDRIPYNPSILSQIIRQPVGVIEKAIKVFQEFELIEIMDNGAIYMMDIQNYIGHSSSEADRQRNYQKRIAEAGGVDSKLIECKKSNKKSNRFPTPEIEIEKEIELDIEKERDIEINKKTFVGNKFPDDSDEVSISEYLLLKILNNNESFKKPNIQSWASHVDKMIRLDKRSLDDIRFVIDFSTSDTFWKSNILSTGKLRDKFDQLMMQAKQPKKQSQQKYEGVHPSRNGLMDWAVSKGVVND